MEIAQLVVTVVVAAITAVGAAMVTPWAQRAVETRRRRDERRLAVVNDGRQLIGDWHRDRPRSVNRDFMNDERFERLRPHLSTATLALLNDPTVVVEVGGHGDQASTAYTRAVAADIDRLEKEWRLI